jgi:hypothetical protein
MKEDFLHFLWQHQYFNKRDLQTSEGENIEIFSPGTRNTNAGPDFLNARLKIGDVTWVGNVEIHIKSSDWKNHNHHCDPGYENVVLHVVWEEDVKISRIDNTSIPCLCLRERTDHGMMNRYLTLDRNTDGIPCSFHLKETPEIILLHAQDKSLIARLQRKAHFIINELNHKNQGDWEETAYQLLCQNFGFKLNAEPFLQLAVSLPYRLIKKHSDNILHAEALLFGMAGMLNRKFSDQYPNLLKKEFDFLSHKYGLENSRLNGSEWKFLRLRPANFPTIRIAQLASIICSSASLFSLLTDFESLSDLKKSFQRSQGEYWKNHYVFDTEVSGRKGINIGDDSIDNIIINTIVPLMSSYGKSRDQYELVDKAIGILEELKPEDNRITRQWKAAGMPVSSAAGSQGAIELFNNHCRNRLCLNCSIGVSVLKEEEEIYWTS